MAKNLGGRPPTPIDPEEFMRVLGSFGLSRTGMAAYFKCDPTSIDRFIRRTWGKNAHFSEIKEQALLQDNGLGRKARLHLIKESEDGNMGATKILLKNFAKDWDIDVKQTIEISRPVDETMEEMEAYFASKEVADQDGDTGSDMG